MLDELLKYVKQSDLDKGLEYESSKVRYVGSNNDLNVSTHNFIVTSEHNLKSYIVSIDEDDTDKEIVGISCKGDVIGLHAPDIAFDDA